MQRGGYDHIPNRIIPPTSSMLANEYRRAEYEQPRIARIPSETHSTRVPLLGDAPAEFLGGFGRQYTYNGPVVGGEPLRRRGFDKGPYGEDVTRPEGRQPLLKTPNLAVERIGGDMDISRSRSVSPVRRIDARSVRDDRKKERQHRRKSRSRSRSRSSRSRSRDRNHRDRGSTRAEKPTPSLSGPVRDGVVCIGDNYYEFLTFFISSLNEKVGKSSDREIKGARKLCETVSRATELEKAKIILPPDFNSSDREKMLYCDTTIEGLPSAIFFGSGYGPREHYAKYSAAKDLIDKCHRIGVINSELYAAIGGASRLDRSFQKHFSTQISKAVNAVILLIKRMAHEHLPPGFMTLRHLEPEIIERFKSILRMVMIDVYYQGVDSHVSVPKAIETGYDDNYSRGSGSGSSSSSRRERVKEEPKDDIDDRVVQKRSEEAEWKAKLELEFAKKRAEMEQEIRQKVLEEERAKIRAELEMEKKIESMMAQQQRYQNDREKEKREREELEKRVENELASTVGQLEQQFVEIRGKKLDNVHDMIQKSPAFQALQACSSTLTLMTIEQKQQLTVDLKSLLDYITVLIKSTSSSGYSGNSSGSSSGQYQGYSPASSSSYPKQREDQIKKLTVGDMHLRSLSTSEQRQLRTGNKVIAQDMKTGIWKLATVVKVNEDRAVLTVGTNTWKKYLDELYTEDEMTQY